MNETPSEIGTRCIKHPFGLSRKRRPFDSSRRGAHKPLTCELLEPRQLLAVLVVDTTSDVVVADGLISLREAVLAANTDTIADPVQGTQAGSGDDTIRFDPTIHGQTIALGLGVLPVSDVLVIEGPGTDQMAIAAQSSSVFQIDDGLLTNIAFELYSIRVDGRIEAMEHIVITDAFVKTVTVTGTDVNLVADNLTGNFITFNSDNGSLNVANSDLVGGIVVNSVDGDATITNSRILQGSFGIWVITENGDITVRDTYVAHHTERGISIDASGPASVTIERTTSSYNGDWNSFQDGGGVNIQYTGPASGSVRIVNSTISSNTAGDDGGGIHIRTIVGTSSIEILHSTIVNNVARDAAGGMAITTFTGTSAIRIEHSIIAGNTDADGPIDILGDVSGATWRHNLIGNGTPYLAEANPDLSGNIVGGPVGGLIDPILRPLTDNGGPTPTHGLLPRSPAINAGDPNFVPPPNFDQRGAPFARVVGLGIDIGSFEFSSPADFNGDGILTCADVDALVDAIVAGTNDPLFDLTGDGLVDQMDLMEWVEAIFGTLPGDGNLDGFVDGADFNIWNAHKFTSNNGWCAGDFNADGHTDGPDFNIWNAHKFQLAAIDQSVHGTSIDSIIDALSPENDLEPQRLNSARSNGGIMSLWHRLRKRHVSGTPPTRETYR